MTKPKPSTFRRSPRLLQNKSPKLPNLTNTETLTTPTKQTSTIHVSVAQNHFTLRRSPRFSCPQNPNSDEKTKLNSSVRSEETATIPVLETQKSSTRKSPRFVMPQNPNSGQSELNSSVRSEEKALIPVPETRKSTRKSPRCFRPQNPNSDESELDSSVRGEETATIPVSETQKSSTRKSPRFVMPQNPKRDESELNSSFKSEEIATVPVSETRKSATRKSQSFCRPQNPDSDKSILNSHARSEEDRKYKKFKRGGGCDDSNEGNEVKGGWTKEQEMALQRAYFATKPTPHFWKRVSKMVPGKSAQDCFDKVNADHITPEQRQRTRAKRLNSNLEFSPLSASKLLDHSGLKFRRGKQKIYHAQKKVRQLLQKHNCLDQQYQADLFSVLEPHAHVTAQDSPLDAVFSTPDKLEIKVGFLKECRGRSTGCKKSPEFTNLHKTNIVSPPVLKEVKNKVLHEKYIDRLHVREAKRMAEYLRVGKSIIGKENSGQILVQKVDVVKAAKSALVCGARDAIDQLKNLQSIENSSCSEDYGDDSNNEDKGEL